jgi:shikimate kinase
MNNSSFIPARTVALIGMPASGKSSVGSLLAKQLHLPLADADAVMVKESGMSISDYFVKFGEPKFRTFERETIAKIMAGPLCVAPLGGGAFMNAETRALLKRRAVTVWIKADKTILLERALKHGGRPLLEGDPAGRLAALLTAREPIYAQADISVESGTHPIDVTVERIVKALEGCTRAKEAAS